MNNFLVEAHSHTGEVSPCAHLDARDVIAAYIREGYNGIVITDHLSSATFKDIHYASHQEKIHHFLTGYNNAKKFAGNRLQVYLGFEISFTNDPNDYLVYGASEDFLYHYDSLQSLDIKKFKTIAEANNLLVFQAHPFRYGMRVQDYRYLDGIEVYNGNSSHNSNNDIAEYWAETNQMKMISGSDFHCFFGMRPGGLIFNEPIITNAGLVEALRYNMYQLRGK